MRLMIFPFATCVSIMSPSLSLAISVSMCPLWLVMLYPSERIRSGLAILIFCSVSAMRFLERSRANFTRRGMLSARISLRVCSLAIRFRPLSFMRSYIWERVFEARLQNWEEYAETRYESFSNSAWRWLIVFAILLYIYSSRSFMVSISACAWSMRKAAVAVGVLRCVWATMSSTVSSRSCPIPVRTGSGNCATLAASL